MRKTAIIVGCVILFSSVVAVNVWGVVSVVQLVGAAGEALNPTEQKIADFRRAIEPIPDIHIDELRGDNYEPFFADIYAKLSVDPGTTDDRVTAIVDIVGRFVHDHSSAGDVWPPVTLTAGEFSLEITGDRAENATALAKFELGRTATPVPGTAAASAAQTTNGRMDVHPAIRLR